MSEHSATELILKLAKASSVILMRPLDKRVRLCVTKDEAVLLQRYFFDTDGYITSPMVFRGIPLVVDDHYDEEIEIHRRAY